MLRFAKTDIARGYVPDTAAGHADKDVYDRHAGNVYRQALFTLDDAVMAEQVVSDVIVEECVRPAAVICGQDAERRLAVCTYRRCLELASSPEWTSRVHARRTGDCVSCASLGSLTARERGVLGLALFGALAYRQVGVDLGICASDVAAMLRAVLVEAAAAKPGPLPYASQEWVWP